MLNKFLKFENIAWILLKFALVGVIFLSLFVPLSHVFTPESKFPEGQAYEFFIDYTFSGKGLSYFMKDTEIAEEAPNANLTRKTRKAYNSLAFIVVYYCKIMLYLSIVFLLALYTLKGIARLQKDRS